MAKIIDLRGSGGQVVYLGDALALPASNATVADATVPVIAGSLRFNPDTNTIEYLPIGSTGWQPLVAGGSGGGPGSITTNPSPLTMATNSTQGTVVGTLAAPSLTYPVTFSIVNSTGQFEIQSTDKLVVGPVDTDIANGTSVSVTIMATGSDGISSVTEVKTVAVTATGGPAAFDANYVSGTYNVANLSNLTNTQSLTITETNNDGSSQSFPPNTVRRTDLGVWAFGETVDYIMKNSETPVNWVKTQDPTYSSSVGTLTATTGGDTISPSPATMTQDNAGVRFWPAANGSAYDGFTEALSAGDKIMIHARFRQKATNQGPIVTISWGATPTEESWYCMDISTSSLDFISSTNYNDTGNYSTKVRQAFNPVTGWVDIVISHTVIDPTNFMVSVGAQDGGGTYPASVDFGGCQVYKSVSERDWIAVVNTTVTAGPDTYILSGTPATTLQATQGWFGMEFQALDHATMGTVGAGGVAGTLLDIGGTAIIQPNGPTEFTVNGVTQPLGMSGWRGIVRVCITWDGTGWSAWANGGKIASGTGTGLGASGTVTVMKNITGRLRRLAGGTSRLADADGQAWSQIHNRTFINPGTALVPGAATTTFFDDFDAETMRHRSSTWPYPQPYDGNPADAPDGEALAQLYKASYDADNTRRWMPRSFYMGYDQSGSGANQINNEAQHYLDPDYPGNKQPFVYANSCVQMWAFATNSLTTAEQALVPNNPQTNATFEFVSTMMTTWGGTSSPNTNGGFEQKYGVFSARYKFPRGTAFWPAFWLYQTDTSELDMDEYYSGLDPDTTTQVIHTDNFQYNDTGGIPNGKVNLGYDLSQDFHDNTNVWAPDSVKKYWDGELIATMTPNASFNATSKWIIFDFALGSQGGTPGPGTYAALPAAMYIDRVHVLQFGA